VFLLRTATRAHLQNDNLESHHIMKLVKSLAMGALALATVGSSFAATTVKVTGSTAFRKALYAAIVDQFGAANTVAAYKGSNLPGANQAIFKNTATGDVVIACMAGSVGGINWVANSTQVAPVAPFDPSYSTAVGTAWMDVSNLPASANVTVNADKSITTTSGVAVSSPVWSSASTADFTMSDSLQGSTPYKTPAMTSIGGGNIGVVEFMFAKGTAGNIDASAYSRLTNMTELAFQNLAANGQVNIGAFTGNAADKATGGQVILVGRDSDSGTRLATAFETGLNDVQTAMNQFKAFNSTSLQDNTTDVGLVGGIIADAEFAADTLSGYSSGGMVNKVLNATVTSGALLSGTATPFVVVAYVGTGDKPASTSQYLSYNGVAWDSTQTATKLGQYTFWTYEQAYYRSNIAAAPKALADAIITKIKPLAGISAGVVTSQMLCARNSEGAVVAPSF